MSITTPIAFIIFNRPDFTKIVFEAIRQAKPKKLFVIADGPRFTEEAQKCNKARAVIQNVDWECEVLTNFSDINLGCKHRVSSGLDWVFSEVEEAIILEDDCLPTPSFFNFCQTLLEYYRHDERIMQICGNNFHPYSINDDSYHFSLYNHIWGWATWRRAWKYFDVEMKTWQQCKKLSLFDSLWIDSYEKKYWIDIFDQVSANLIDTWDYQWTYACWSQSGLFVNPNANLVSNIGFGADATHTFDDSPLANLPTTDIWEIKHPNFVIRHHQADQYIFDYILGGQTMKNTDTILSKIRCNLGRVKRKLMTYLKFLSYIWPLKKLTS